MRITDQLTRSCVDFAKVATGSIAMLLVSAAFAIVATLALVLYTLALVLVWPVELIEGFIGAERDEPWGPDCDLRDTRRSHL